MSANGVITSLSFAKEAQLQPSASSFPINERPPSRRLSSSPRLLSPILEQMSLDQDKNGRSNNTAQKGSHSLKRSKTDPYLPLHRSMLETGTAVEERDIRTSVGGQRSTLEANGYKGSDLLGVVKAENAIREVVRRKYSDLKMTFQMLDEKKDGTVTENKFQRVIKTFCPAFTDDHFGHLLLKTGSCKDGSVNYIAFLEKFRIGPVMMAIPPQVLQAPPRTASIRSDSVSMIEAKLREKLTSNFGSFMKSVRLFDYNRDGHIQKVELKRILDTCCVKLQDSQFSKLMQKYVINKNSPSVDYMDFLKRLGIEANSADGRQTSPVTKNLFLDRPSNSRDSCQIGSDEIKGLTLGQIEKKFREKVLWRFNDLKRAFVAFDKKRDGYVTLDELKRIVVHFVFSMSDQMFSKLMERCGVRATHQIPYDHFLDKFKHRMEDGNGQTIPIKPSHKVNPIREATSPLQMKELWDRLHDHIINNYSSAKRAFLAFDDDKDGRVRRREFRKVLDTFPFKLTEDQFTNLMCRVDPEGKGFVSYHEFLRTFERKESEGAHPWLHGSRKINKTKPMAKVSHIVAEEVLRDKIMDNWSTIGKAFIQVDENSDGFISKSELDKLLQRYHIHVAEEQFSKLWKKCDENQDGKIQYHEFLKSLGVDITPGDIKGVSARITDESEEKIQLMKTDQLSRQYMASKNALTRTIEMNADEVISILKDHFIQRSANLRKTFLKYDHDVDGKLSKSEFRMTLRNLGMQMPDDQFKELTNRLGFYKGTMSYSDFVHKFEEIEVFGEGGKTLHMNNHRYNKVKERSESMTAEEIEVIMRKKMLESFQTLRQAFYAVDSNHDAQITRPEFRRLLDMFMIPINDAEFDRLMGDKLKVPKNGTISYREFLRRFQHGENVQKGHPWLFSQHSPNTTYALKNLTAEEAHVCLQEKAKDRWHSVSTAFRSFDKDNNSIVTKGELKTVLHRFNIAISKGEFNRLWQMYDTDKNGYVDHEEFLHRLGIEIAPGDVNGISNKITKGSEDEIHRHNHNQKMKQHKAAVNQANTTSFMSAMDVENKLRDKFRDNYSSFRKAFEQMDANKDGLVSRSELMKILYDHHFYMDDNELAVLLNRLGFGTKKHLSYVHFLSAFEDPRYAQNPPAKLDSRSSVSSKVSFDSVQDLTPEEAIAKLRKTVLQNAESIKSAFGAFDKSGNGRITVEELHRLVDSFCFKISPKQFKHLLSKISVQLDNTVDYESFMDSFQRTDVEVSKKWLENMLKEVKSTSPGSKAKISPLSYEMFEDQISEMIKVKQKKIVKAFADLDTDRSGLMNPSTVRQVLSEFALRLSDDHFNQLWNKFDRNGSGLVSYKDLMRHFTGVDAQDGSNTMKEVSPRIDDANNNEMAPSPRRSESPESNQGGQQTIELNADEIIKSKIRRHWKGLLKSCRAADQGSTGDINASKFKSLLQNHGISLSDDEFSYLASKYDIDGKGRISYMDLLKKYMLQSKEQKREHDVSISFETENNFLNSLIARIKREVHDDWKMLRRGFKAADRSGDGTCPAVEMRQILRKFKVGVTDEEFYHLMTYFDKEMSGKVPYNDFLKALIS